MHGAVRHGVLPRPEDVLQRHLLRRGAGVRHDERRVLHARVSMQRRRDAKRLRWHVREHLRHQVLQRRVLRERSGVQQQALLHPELPELQHGADERWLRRDLPRLLRHDVLQWRVLRGWASLRQRQPVLLAELHGGL